MQDKKTGQSTGSTTSASGGSAGTRGRAGRDQDENARVADTSPGDLRTGSQASEGTLGGPGMQDTAAERGSAGLEEVPGMEGQVRRRETSMHQTSAMPPKGQGQTGTQRGSMSQGQMQGSGAYDRLPVGEGKEGETRIVSHEPGGQESEEAGMEQMSRALREAREEGDPEMQESMQGHTGQAETGMEGETEDYDVVIITVREYAISERERGMSDRERGMSERERAMFDRECAMSDRERSSAWGGREEESSSGGMTSGRSRTS